MKRIDLNSDIGESFGVYQLGDDAAVIDCVSSVNIACGFHAGDPMTMARTLTLAAKRGLALGAHPGYPDLLGFGRRDLQASPREIYSYVLYQVAALAGFAKAQGTKLSHVKPHGALYNRAADDRAVADAIARAVADVDRQLILYGLANSALIEAAKVEGLRYAREGFADRAYLANGRLAPRTMRGAVLSEIASVLQQVEQIVLEGHVTSLTGERIALPIDTICLHGDQVAARQLAVQIKDFLNDHHIAVQALQE